MKYLHHSDESIQIWSWFIIYMYNPSTITKTITLRWTSTCPPALAESGIKFSEGEIPVAKKILGIITFFPKALPCNIHTMTFFRQKSKSTYGWMRTLNYTTTPTYQTSRSSAIPHISSRDYVKFLTLIDHTIIGVAI